jgi:hypothetical protein
MQDKGVYNRSGRQTVLKLDVGNPTEFFELPLDFPSHHVLQQSNEGNRIVHCPQASHKGILQRGGTSSRLFHRTIEGDVWPSAHKTILTLDKITVVPNWTADTGVGPKKEPELFEGKYRGLAGPVSLSPQHIIISTELTRPHILNNFILFLSGTVNERPKVNKQNVWQWMCGTKRPYHCAVAKDKGKLYVLTNKMPGVGTNGCTVFYRRS